MEFGRQNIELVLASGTWLACGVSKLRCPLGHWLYGSAAHEGQTRGMALESTVVEVVAEAKTVVEKAQRMFRTVVVKRLCQFE